MSTQHTDRELLELAAKAAGHEFSRSSGEAISSDGRRAWIKPGIYWQPFDDDGDALRLAVKTGEPFVVRRRCVTTMGGLVEDFDPAVPGDDLRATRRAILRAAASIGRAMP